MKRFYLFLFLGVLALTSFHSDEEDEISLSYIYDYMELAHQESKRSSIPASVIMAQAIHESRAGRSDLAIKANNHFGIKCKHYWKGETYFHKDDDYDKKGRLMNSCFRSYSSVKESYKDHSDFLVNSDRYDPIFESQNYKEWCRGLKKCGYATDKFYAEKLIKIIEKFKLYKLDLKEEIYPPAKSGMKFDINDNSYMKIPTNYKRQRYID